MKKEAARLVVSDSKNRIHAMPGLEAAGMEGGRFFRLSKKEFVKLPSGSQLFVLPGRLPVGYDRETKNFISLNGLFAVAAFISPGFTATYSAAYTERLRPKILPLFSYSAVVLWRGEFYVTAVKVDNDPRHDPRFIDIGMVRKRAPVIKKLFPKNRLIKHLADCALTHGCPGARNFFLHRYEGPLPTSPSCNARCAGCISCQPDKECPPTQPRIKFMPTPEEVCEAALFHIENVDDPVVSFGQGCDGEPLMAGRLIEKSIRLIRKNTRKGLINMNTNASLPRVISRLLDAGLDSIRVSMNSVRPEYYKRYYKPKNYTFRDVVRSIELTKKRKAFVSINYLTMPGFTDSEDEFNSLIKFIESTGIDMIQWRNMNFDPLWYFRKIGAPVDESGLIGVRAIMKLLKKRFPGLMMGYFNPSKGGL